MLVGDGMIGRVVNVLGLLIDGKGLIYIIEIRVVEILVFSIIDRSLVNELL